MNDEELTLRRKLAAAALGEEIVEEFDVHENWCPVVVAGRLGHEGATCACSYTALFLSRTRISAVAPDLTVQTERLH